MAEEKEIIFGQGAPMVVDPPMGMFDDVVDDMKWKAQLLARETKLSSGVLSTVTMGFAIGFLLAVIMMIGPFFVFKGGL